MPRFQVRPTQVRSFCGKAERDQGGDDCAGAQIRRARKDVQGHRRRIRQPRAFELGGTIRKRNHFKRLQNKAAPAEAFRAECRPFGASADPSKKYAAPTERGRLQRGALSGRLRADIFERKVLRRVLIVPLQSKGGQRG